MTAYGEYRPPRRRGGALGLVIAVAVLVLAGLGTAVAVRATGRPADGGSPPVEVPATPGTGPAAAGDGGRLATGRQPGPPGGGDGTFRAVRDGGPRVGQGRIYRYRVEVENGIDIDGPDFARDVDRILADPRGWTAKGGRGFRRVSSAPADFVVRLATPRTVDRICGGYGLDTDGEASCRGGPNVIINLKRWTRATDAYADDVAMYRHLVINHEVGHFLGFSHATCPGPGEPAPVMQTQMYGLHGCVRNAWPYP